MTFNVYKEKDFLDNISKKATGNFGPVIFHLKNEVKGYFSDYLTLREIHCSWLFERGIKTVNEAMKMYSETKNIAVTNLSILWS